MPNGPPLVDRSELFKSIATSIEQKHIRRHNEKPGVSRRHENRPSIIYTNISNLVKPLATEMLMFRKMLNERAQDYIFTTPAYSKMSSEDREIFDQEVREKSAQFELFVNQLGHRVNSSDGLQNSTERSHLAQVHKSLGNYLKEILYFVSVLKKERLKRLQVKNGCLAEDVRAAQRDGHAFKYCYGLDELSQNADLELSGNLLRKLEELGNKTNLVDFKYQRGESQEPEYDLVEDLRTLAFNKHEEVGETKDGWDEIEYLETDDPLPKGGDDNRVSPILFTEEVRNRRNQLNSFNPEQEQLRDSYERWKEEQGAQFAEQVQKQTTIMKKDFVKADQDDEMEKLEQQFAEIQSHFSVFSDEIMDQERDIDVIHDLALHTSENLIDGNEWIRKAITNSARQRVILLFCILVFSLTLLFIDWYNP